MKGATANKVIGLVFIVMGFISTTIDGDVTPCIVLGMIGAALILAKENVFDL